MATKKMKSFRLDEWTAKMIADTAADMGLSQSDVVALAVQAFTTYGVDHALGVVDYRNNDADAYSTLIEMSHHGSSIECEIQDMIRACAEV